MPDRPETACLVVADISGYTSYLAGVELDHAQDILADLIDSVVRALRPPFRLAKLEGDAVFAYVATDTIDGSALQDTIEHCHIAFRRRLRDIGQASQCDCNACALMPRLDLKFAVHHGPIARQRMAGREELVGCDVIVVHRLLKNSVQEALGLGAYALYTEACTRAMGQADPAAAGASRHLDGGPSTALAAATSAIADACTAAQSKVRKPGSRPANARPRSVPPSRTASAP